MFNAAGKVALIATTAKGDKANGIGAGAATARLVRYVAVASAAELRTVSGLRADIRAAAV